METVTISKEEYLKLKLASAKLRKLEKVDFDLVRQFRESLEAVKKGKIRRVA
tara:strand:- start:3634 stop:3789 length:156 start_codon:yes stop_codon:yes gene_type:complete